MASFLTPAQLASRWNLAITTLSQWRWSGRGPEFHKIGRCVSYALEDIEAFEARKRRQSTSGYRLDQSTFNDRLDSHVLDNAGESDTRDEPLLNSKPKLKTSGGR